MDILKDHSLRCTRSMEEIDEQAALALRRLAGRKAVDVKGPLGWNVDAVSEGILSLVEESPVEDMLRHP